MNPENDPGSPGGFSNASPIASRVRAAADEVSTRVMTIREDIHAHPELRFEAHRTAELCAIELESLGLKSGAALAGPAL